MPKMTKPSATKYPALKNAWDDYGHAIPWDKLIDIKIAHWGYGGGLACLAWDAGDGMIEYADLECVDNVWEMNNDGGQPITLAQWQEAYIPDECNWLKVPKIS